jgi:hypothetical protein
MAGGRKPPLNLVLYNRFFVTDWQTSADLLDIESWYHNCFQLAMFEFQSIVNPMKEVHPYIQHFTVGSQVQKLDDIPSFPITLNKYEGFGRENIEPGERKNWRVEHAA